VDLAEALLPEQVAAAQRSKWLAGGLEASEFWQSGWYGAKYCKRYIQQHKLNIPVSLLS